MAWKIDKDYLDPAGTPHSNVGRMSVQPLGDAPRFRFRLLDDDGEIYYGGEFDLAHDEDSADWESSPYGAYKWGEYDSGTTDFQMHAAEALAAEMTSQRYLDAISAEPQDWISIYG